MAMAARHNKAARCFQVLIQISKILSTYHNKNIKFDCTSPCQISIIKGHYNQKVGLFCLPKQLEGSLSLQYKLTLKMKIGEDVLSKIEKLITQIDKPKRSRPFPPICEKENLDYEKYNKLYQEHRVKKARQAMKIQQKIQDQTQRCSPFKVTNKHSIFLNSQQPRKPLHQRIQELQNKKMEDLIHLREKYQHKEIQYEDDEEVAREMEEKRRAERKYTQKQVEQLVSDLNQKERARVEKINRMKIQTIQEHSKDFRRKPYVSRETEALWGRYKMKKQLSTSVFQRFQQYELDRKAHLEDKQKQIMSKVTPFVPRISQNSRLIASRSASRLDVRSRTVSRSASCKCLTRNKKHNRSTAMNTSRKV